MDNKWDGNRPAAIRLAPAESGAGAGPLPVRCWHDGGSDGSAGAGPLLSQFALSPPVRCRLRRGWPQLPEPARWWAASAMLSGKCCDAAPPGPRLNIKTVFPRYGESHVIDLMFNMGIPILVRRHLYIETTPRNFQWFADWIHLIMIRIKNLFITIVRIWEQVSIQLKPKLNMENKLYETADIFLAIHGCVNFDCFRNNFANGS